MKATGDTLARVTGVPDLSELQREYERAGVSYGWWGDDATDSRLMKWDGQSKDGRKHKKDKGTDVFPWENAFDTRVPTVDTIINYLVSVLMVAFDRGVLRCQATEAGDLDSAARLQKVMEYYRQLLRRTLREEAELLLQNALTYGAALWTIGWERRLGTTKDRLLMDDLLAMAASAEPGNPLAALPQLLMDPAMDDAVVELLLGIVPDLQTKQAAKRALKALRNEGVAEYRRAFVVRNAPCVRALRFGRDVFMPPETSDLQRARVLFVRDFYTETEIREKVQTEGWNAQWAELAIASAGKMSSWSSLDREDDRTTKTLTLQWTDIDTENNLIEIVHAYQRQLDEQDIPRIQCTIWCPCVKEGRTETATANSYAAHYPADLAHQTLPMVVYQWERFSRRILASRGVPEIAYTWQLEEKTQCDMLADLASISVNPPRRTTNTRGQKYEWGPGAQTVGRQGELEPFQTTAQNAPLAFQIMEMLRRRRAEYFGIMDETVPAALWQARLGHIVGNWLACCEEMFGQMAALVLDEENVSTEELERITGVSLEGLDRSPEAIARRFDWRMQFDARDLDMDYTLKKLETVATLAVPLDREGMISYGKLVGAILTQVDPTYAEALLGDPQAAAEKIVGEVDNEFVRMLAGNEAKYVVNDPTAQLRLQAANAIVQKNPKYQQAYQGDERFREVVDNFMKNLQQSIVQTGENVQTGRTGVKPVS